MRNYIIFAIFLAINFLGLYLGGLATGPGVQSQWYDEINQAPWTPPGAVFGIVWTLIGITWSFIGVYLWNQSKSHLLQIYAASWFLNLAWNPLFFSLHATLASGIVILLLSCAVLYIIECLRRENQFKISLFGYLYFFWLMIASSLNWFIVIMN